MKISSVKKKKSCLPSGNLFRRSLMSSIYSVVKFFEINFKSTQSEGGRLSALSSFLSHVLPFIDNIYKIHSSISK